MKITNIKDYKDGWIVGGFKPSAFFTKDFEVCYKTHKKNEKWDAHYHKVGTEISLLISGEMVIQGKNLKSGDVFTIFPYEVADPIFLTDCTVLVIKTPSDTSDKYKV